MNTYKHKSQNMTYLHHGSGETAFVWAHGWGTSHRCFKMLSNSLKGSGQHYLLDLPGFGYSPQPQGNWNIKDYADYIYGFLKTIPAENIVWVGHSFGCRIGIKLSALYPNTLSHMILIAGSGLPQKRSLYEKTRIFLSIRLFKTMKFFIRDSENLEKLKARFGSPDYKNAGSMRQIFMNCFSEHLQKDSEKIKCPVALYYGDQDSETKPDMGIRYSNLIPRSQLEIFHGLDHYTILSEGQHQLAQRIKRFVKESHV